MTHPRPRGYASSAEPIEQLPVVRTELIHSRCGKPAAEHPYPASPTIACPFPELPLAGFPIVPVEPTIRVCGIPDPSSIPPEVMRLLDDLARACRDAYGLGVEVTADDPEQLAEALDMLRRGLGL